MEAKVKEFSTNDPQRAFYRVREAASRMLTHLTPDPARAGIQETPDRVARMWLDELTSGHDTNIETLFRRFPADGYEGMVVVKDIPLISTCEHHLLPIVGYAHIGYIPDQHVIGLSKLPRIVNAYGRRLQIQERLTHQISEAIDTHLEPLGVIVVISAEHSCMTVRGVQAPGTRTVTCSVTGKFRDPNEDAREEFMGYVK